jgi:hypothetical protein
VFENLWPLLLIHHYFTFLFNSFFVSTHTHNKISMGKELFSLFKNLRMAYMIHVKDSIRIDSHRIVWISSIRLYKKNKIRIIKLTTPGRIIYC